MKHVTIQPKAVFKNTLQLIPEQFLVFSNKPTPTVAPTWQWVVDSGILRREPVIITSAELSSIATPREGVILTNFSPIAYVIFLPYTNRPTAIPIPPSPKIQ